MAIKFSLNYDEIVSTENLLEAWNEFVKGKRAKNDVQDFSFYLMDNILLLHRDLVNHTYSHGAYQAFSISDPKPRSIHKAPVVDRLLHHAIHRKLSPFFERIFIADSYSCRTGKGAHKALEKFQEFSYKVSKNNTKTCWILKCDIRKFFASINHPTLKEILAQSINDRDVLWLLGQIINSFHSDQGKRVGLPLGNLTSQLLVNVYMNRFDQFAKHKLRAKCYIRYADDFVFFSESKEHLSTYLTIIKKFLARNLQLQLHPNKVTIKTLASGVDFLGWVNFPDYRVLRTTTKKRMLKRVAINPNEETLNSYLGMLKHGNSTKLEAGLIKEYLVNQ
jgi:RNA-directed DNA polymerase